MKKCALLVAIVLSVTLTYSQIKFEKGYFINDEDKKTECFIKNSDWGNNPTEIEYKLDESSEPKRVTVLEVKEFGIYKSSRYVVANVNIDRSSSRVDMMDTHSDPVFKEERLFLKVLVEGKANLYSYSSRNLIRFFYSINDSPIEQLIFKLYVANEEAGSTKKISENNRFRQQLWIGLSCSAIEKKRLESIKYEKKALIKIFSLYNICNSGTTTSFEDKVKRQLFTIAVRPRMNYTSFSASTAADKNYNFDWEGKASFGVGIEGEFFLPFNKDKWSLLVEPTYQRFKASTSTLYYFDPGNSLVAEVDFKSIQIPLGVRHYFLLNNNNRIFINASAVFEFASSSSQIKITRLNGQRVADLELEGARNFAFGAGFKHKAFGIEFRYQTTRAPLNSYTLWDLNTKTYLSY